MREPILVSAEELERKSWVFRVPIKLDGTYGLVEADGLVYVAKISQPASEDADA